MLKHSIDSFWIGPEGSVTHITNRERTCWHERKVNAAYQTFINFSLNGSWMKAGALRPSWLPLVRQCMHYALRISPADLCHHRFIPPLLPYAALTLSHSISEGVHTFSLANDETISGWYLPLLYQKLWRMRICMWCGSLLQCLTLRIKKTTVPLVSRHISMSAVIDLFAFVALIVWLSKLSPENSAFVLDFSWIGIPFVIYLAIFCLVLSLSQTHARQSLPTWLVDVSQFCCVASTAEL